MKAVLATLAFLSILPSAAFARGTSPQHRITDALGTSVSVSLHPVKVIPLAPSLAELVADLTGDDFTRIVGVTDHSDYPPPLSKLPSVGPYPKFSIEKVVSLKPDLVLATTDGNSKDQIQHLRELGVPVVVMRGDTIDQVKESIRITGEALGESDRARRLISRLEKGIANFRARAKARAARAKPMRVMLQLWENPLNVVGGGSFLSDALTVIGAENVYGKSESHYPNVTIEDALQKNPDAIILLSLSGAAAGSQDQPFLAMARHWSEFPFLSAVKAKRVKVLKSEELLRPTLRLLEGISALEKAVYGPN